MSAPKNDDFTFDLFADDPVFAHAERIVAPVDNSLVDEEESVEPDSSLVPGNVSEVHDDDKYEELIEEELSVSNNISEAEVREMETMENSIETEAEKESLPELNRLDGCEKTVILEPEDVIEEVDPLEQGNSIHATIPVDSVILVPEIAESQPVIKKHEKPTVRNLNRAALGWLASNEPTAAAVQVPTRLARFKAGAAAFWNAPLKNRILIPERTVIVEVRPDRESCWTEYAAKTQAAENLKKEQRKKLDLEESIRKNEPELLDSDVLFEEAAVWNYANSINPAYKQCLSNIKQLENALYRGSRFERIRKASVANELYLLVPRDCVDPLELAEGWGLLYLNEDFTVEKIKDSEFMVCPQENLLHLAQNIAASCLNDVLFANGVYQDRLGNVRVGRPPRRRRPFIK